jgi:hypothetical protein
MDGSSWVNALAGDSAAGNGYTKLAQALRTATPGMQFWVAQGVYPPATDNDRNKSFEIVQNVSIYGGFQGTEVTLVQRNWTLYQTILSGEIGAANLLTDNSYHVMMTVGGTWTNTSTLDGFYIKWGYAMESTSPSGSSLRYGGGILTSHKLQISNSWFDNNYANQLGGGVYSTGNTNVDNCIFTNNYGSGFSCYGSVVVIRSSKFSNNGSWAGGGIYCRANIKIINCLVVNNNANNGGGIYCEGTQTQIQNSTIANNYSSNGNVCIGSGVNSSAIINNSIIYGNTITLFGISTVTCKYSCIQGTTTGVGIINADPLFVNPTYINGGGANGLMADWSLRWCSPCFNVGDNSLIPTGTTTDIDGNPRIRHNIVDMGAYELDTTGLIKNIIGYSNSRIYVSDSNAYFGNGTTWQNAVAGNVESCKYTGRNLLYEAMKDASPGTEIWVKKGVYPTSMTNNRNHAYTIGSGVKVYGGFEGDETTIAERGNGTTIFSGDIGTPGISSDNAYHVFNLNSQNTIYPDTACLSGVSIKYGYANGTNENSRGAGILLGQNTKLKLTSVNVIGNTGMNFGGGVYNEQNSILHLIDCRIDSNKMIQRYYGSGTTQPYSGNGTGVYNKGILKAINTSFSFNTPADLGGGIYNQGLADLDSCRIDSNVCNGSGSSIKGGGIYNTSNMQVHRGQISYNTSYYYGGGITNTLTGNAEFRSVKINNNHANSGNAGGIENLGQLILRGCEVQNNYGGGLWNSGSLSNALVEQSSVSFNTLTGGIQNFGVLHVNGCRVCNNSNNSYGGGLYNPTSVRNTLVANNTKGGTFTTGGGIWLGMGCQGIYNCTVVNNSGQGVAATTVSGQTYKEVPVADTFDIQNSIIYGNDVAVSGNFTIFNSCYENGYNGQQNIFDNPLFENPSTGIGINFNGQTADWSLKNCSPCVDRGNNGFLTIADSVDANASPRVINGLVDMGALERQTPAINPVSYSSGVVRVSDVATTIGSGTSWAQAVAGNEPSCRYPGYTKIYETMRDAPPSCQVWVKKGTYLPNVDNNRYKSFIIDPKTLIYGGFSGNEALLSERDSACAGTILSGNIGSSSDSLDNLYHVVFTYPSATPWADTAILDGIEICHGTANYVSGTTANNDYIMGGGLFINTNVNILLNHCRIRENSADGNYMTNYTAILGGAGIYNRGMLLATNSEVSGNAVIRTGAGIFNEQRMTLKNCLISSNRITFPGGSYTSNWGGGGIHNYLAGQLILDGCIIKNNRSANNLPGGGIHNRGKCTLKNSLVENNFSARDGGGMISSGPVKIWNSHFTLNQAAYLGGAIFASDSLLVDSCLFDYNAAMNGPNIRTGGYAVISNTEICRAVTPGQAGIAGGIDSYGKTRVIRCNIHSNNLHGIEFFPNPGGVLNIVVIHQGADGGGILHHSDTLWVDRCLIHHNLAAGGGGVAIYGGKAYVSQSKITDNFCAYGAAFYNKSKLVISNCLIANNSYYNGGLFQNVGNCTTQITNSTVSNNLMVTGTNNNAVFVHGAFQATTPNHFKLANCIINSTTSLTGYFPGTTGTDTINYSCVNAGFQGIGNINAIPGFINPTAGNDTTYDAIHANWSLSACSPCINAGADSLTTDSLDLAGNPRKYHTIDMGALELKYDSSVTALWVNNIAETSAAIHWQRSVKPCETVVFIKDTAAGVPVPVPGAVYNADTVYGNGTNLAGWFCLNRGLDSITGVSGLLPGTTYRVAVFNRILDTIYDVPALMNFTTPGTIAPVKIVNSDTIHAGESECFNAGIELIVGGSGTPFRISNGGTVELISGQKIRLLPGTTVEPGGYLHAHIAPNGPWCYQTKSTTDDSNDKRQMPNAKRQTSDVFCVKVYPNPVSDLLTVSWMGEKVAQTSTTLVLKNLSGKTVFRQVVNGVDDVTLSLRNLSHGLYFLSVETNSGAVVLKIVRE